MLLRFLNTESGRKAMNLAMLGISEHLSKYGMFNARTCRGLVRENCIDGSCCGLVRLYACMGLHRYNLLQGTNLQLVDVKRYNKTVGSPAGSFYITLYATDPSTGNCLTFQTAVNVECCGEFVLTSYVAGPRGTVTNPKALVRDNYRVGNLPECPKENPFENRNRFYQVISPVLMKWVKEKMKSNSRVL
ncbi:PREDICTED: UPF0725 protein At1g02770-like [Camelina sativa]|uniref:UPF0725 protein At1g02770-like n=1 Tax=Camelina sativa TaxID=90675 RepID=A0ABM1QDV2_CAMSA|nr:PREDICTED: UPF0725 protein At1g02770-like [Camelina sativa]XP_019084940.1 PREDICTED: UPF0725 protein At1g02770-like [Camelina sativa]